jgi:hypothetical protein
MHGSGAVGCSGSSQDCKMTLLRKGEQLWVAESSSGVVVVIAVVGAGDALRLELQLRG